MAEIAQVASMDSPASLELAAARLDARMPHDRRAVRQRFALARRLGDDRALDWVITEEMLPAMPEAVVDRARLALGRAALQRGELQAAARHFEAVSPLDEASYGEARLALGALAQGEEAAALAYREAFWAGRTEGLLQAAGLQANAGRYREVEETLALVGTGDALWGEAQILRVEAALALGKPPGLVLGGLQAAQEHGDYLALEAPLLEAAAWRALCWEEHADQLEQQAVDALRPVLGWLQQRAATESPEETWQTFGTGPLPARWFEQLGERPELAPLLLRLQRLDSGPVQGVLAERRAKTVEQLGLALQQAYREAETRLAWMLSPQRPVWTQPRGSCPYCGSAVQHRLTWPFRGEVWRDELWFSVSVPSRCHLQ